MYQCILVPTDGSATSEKALSEAIAMARLSGGSIRLLHIVDALTVAAVSDGLRHPAAAAARGGPSDS